MNEIQKMNLIQEINGNMVTEWGSETKWHSQNERGSGTEW